MQPWIQKKRMYKNKISYHLVDVKEKNVFYLADMTMMSF